MSKSNSKRLPKPLRDILERDEQYKKIAESYQTIRQYDFSKRSDISEYERRINEKFEIGNKRSIKELKPADGLRDLDRAGIQLKKRKSAVLKYAQAANDRFSGKYGKLCIPDELLRLNAAPVGITFGTCEFRYHNDVATALWILDQLEACGNMIKAFDLFPDRRLARDSVMIPPITDSCHSDEVLLCMVYIIRKIDIQDDGTGMTPMQRFREIVKLIDPCAIRRAVNRFESKMWENFDAVLYGIDYYRQRQLKDADELYSTVEACHKFNVEKIRIYQQSNFPKAPPSLVLSTFKPDSPAINQEVENFIFEENRQERLADATLKMAAHVDDTLDNIERAEFGMELVCLLGSYLFGEFEVFKDIEMPAEIKERILSLTIDDPYEICFAHMYMLVADIESVWLYNQAVAVLYAAVALLPWCGIWQEDRGWICPADDFSEECFPADDEGLETEAEEVPITIDYTDALSELYQKRYRDKGLWADPAIVPRQSVKKVNLPQMVYALTGTVIPRRPNDNAEVADRLQNCGVRASQRIMLGQYVLLASTHTGRTSFPDENIPSDTPESGEAELKDRIIKLRAENARLDSVLKETFNEKNAEKRRADSAEAQLEKNRAEIAELRSIIYDRSAFLQGERKSRVRLPYAVKNKITIFGGHEVWLHAIKPLLEGVRYVGPDEKPNMSILMNTDVIWLQTNVMAHSFYNKVLDVARTHNIPVRYFSYSGAEKCAEQLALDDMESE